ITLTIGAFLSGVITGIFYTPVKATIIYIGSLYWNTTSKKIKGKKTPAYLPYYFGDSFRHQKLATIDILEDTFKHIKDDNSKLSDNFDEAKEFVPWFIALAADLYSNEFDDVFDDVFDIVLGIITTFFRLGFKYFSYPVLSFVIYLIYALMQVIFNIVIFILFSFLGMATWFFDWAFRGLKKITTSCPRCQTKYSIGTYECTCGEQHKALVPGMYGVFHRTCTCGAKLGTTFTTKRHKLPGKWLCPLCDFERNNPYQVSISIPVVGGPYSGKTCFINTAISQIEQSADKLNLDFQYTPNHALGDEYSDNVTRLRAGTLPIKTSDDLMKYYQFFLTEKGKKLLNHISICDIAGEAYNASRHIDHQQGYGFANAFLFLIDPLSIKDFQEEMKDKIDLHDHGASDTPIDEILSTLISALEGFLKVSEHKRARKKIPAFVAVVFTKCDIPGLDEKIGDIAVQNYLDNNKNKNIDMYQAKNAVCEEFLKNYGAANFLISLKSKFKDVQFFTSSALGHPQNGMPFEPKGVEDPVLWVIDKASNSIDLKDKWGKSI
ncbi:hypothetical protein GX831_00665, partial [bacterium]|nr:hypothetical protein [bacterium]